MTDLRAALKRVDFARLLGSSGLACLRFGLYCSQLYLLLWFFGLELPWWDGMAGIAAIYLVQAGIPLPPGLNFLTRTELGLLVWQAGPEESVAVLAAYTALFSVNVSITRPSWLLVDRQEKQKSMNSLLLKCLFLLLLAVPVPDAGHQAVPPPSAAPADAPDVCGIHNTTFEAGEEIVYKLYYNWNFVWLAAGEVTFRVHDLPNQYRVTVRGRTYPSYEWFYKVTDNYESYLDKETLLPQIHIKDIHEGGYEKYDRTTFYQDEKRIVSHRGRTRSDTKPKYMSVDPCMHDLISIIYFARNLNYDRLREEPGDPH